jgi:glucokinase
MRILVGDIGGTKTLLAVLEVQPSSMQTVAERRFDSRRYSTFQALVAEFCQEVGADAARACFGIAGPCVDGECRTPNLPWVVRATELAAQLDLPRVDLINDFAAIGYGLPTLSPADYVELQAGIADPTGPIGLIGAGTGLGQAFLVRGPQGYRVHPSEGGHADFAARDPLEAALASGLAQAFGHVSYERVLSGRGLVSVFQFLGGRNGGVPAALVAEMELEDPAAVISRHGLAGTDPVASAALDLFCSIYGAEAGNLALRVLASGGVYVGGGIAPKIVAQLARGSFMRAFRDKGRLTRFMADVPVRVITSPRVALLGAAAFATRPEAGEAS